MADSTTSSKRKRKYITAFSNVSQEEAELILGLDFVTFYELQTPIEQFITQSAPEQLKKEIFKRLNDCMVSDGFPEATFPFMNESVVTDYVGTVLMAMVSNHKCMMNRQDLRLSREKQIISADEQVDGNMEFVVIQRINVGTIRYVLVVEAKRDSFGKGLTQLLLALKSIWDINGDQKLVYGFITTAVDWQLVTYDGKTWKLSERCTLVLPEIGKKEDRWLKNNTQILDAIHSVLSSL